MLEIQSGAKLGYAADYPVLVIKHAVDSKMVRELLEHYLKANGRDKLVELCSEVCGIKKGEFSGGQYYVSVPGGSAPSLPHPSRAKAEAEARRLIEQAGARKAQVFVQVSQFSMQAVAQEI